MLATGWKEWLLHDIEETHGSIGQHFLEQFHRVCLTLPAKDNFYLSWWMRGLRGFSPDTDPLLAPAFMLRENFRKLKVCYIINIRSDHWGTCTLCLLHAVFRDLLKE